MRWFNSTVVIHNFRLRNGCGYQTIQYNGSNTCMKDKDGQDQTLIHIWHVWSWIFENQEFFYWPLVMSGTCVCRPYRKESSTERFWWRSAEVSLSPP